MANFENETIERPSRVAMSDKIFFIFHQTRDFEQIE